MKMVLIIDDDNQFRATLSEILAANGWQVLEAETGEGGLELARRHHPNVLLCDLLMPRGNGFQVCRAIRAEPGLRHTRIIVTSGRDFETDRAAAREAGADQYLTKPVSTEQILRAMKGTELTDSGIIPPSGGGTSSPAYFKFWGVRGSIPTPGPATVHYGGNTSCVEVRAGDELIILDAGTGLRHLGRALTREFRGRPLTASLLLTHTHWDHIQGLPFFGPIYQAGNKIRILGYEGARNSLMHVLSGQMESQYFPVPFQELPGDVVIEELDEMSFQLGSVRVEAWFTNHPGICVGYRINTDDGSLVYMPDNEPLFRHRVETAMWAKKADGVTEYAKQEEERLIGFLRDADVLILDSQYDRDEYLQHVGWGHGCVDDAVAIALRAGIKKLFLFHHDPDHDDAKVSGMAAHGQRLAAEQGDGLQVEAAMEGAVFNLAEISKREKTATAG